MKIKDRILLGLVTGIGGCLVKKYVMEIACKLKWAEFDGPVKAAGLLLPAWKVTTPRGRFIGNVADLAVGGFLSTIFVYLLSATGKDHAQIKGGAYGLLAWGFVYGVLGRLNFSSVNNASPKTIISQSIAHASYGMTTAYLIDKFGYEGLFNGEIPLNATAIKNQTGTLINESQQ